MAHLYLLTQSDNKGYDTYDSCIVCAENIIDAKQIHPDRFRGWNGRTWSYRPETVKVYCIGIADSNLKVGSVVLASFNAG